MRWRIWTIALAAVVTGAVLGGAAAGGMGSGAGDGPEGWRAQHPLMAILGQPFRRLVTGQAGRLLVLRSELNLTAIQRAQLQAIVGKHRQEIDQVVREVTTEHRALRNAIMADKMDEKAVRAAAGDLSKGIGDAGVLIATLRAEAWPVLTPGQRQAIETFHTDTDKALGQFLHDLGQGQGEGAANP